MEKLLKVSINLTKQLTSLSEFGKIKEIEERR